MWTAPFVLLDDAREAGAPARLYDRPVRVVRADTPDAVQPALAEIRRGLAEGLHAAGMLAYEAGLTFASHAVDAGPPDGPLLWFGLFERYETIPAAALPALREDAAVVLMSGAASARPIGAPAYAACNAALEGLARGLAIELAPLRVNCLSPGTTDSDLWRNRAEDIRNSAYTAWAGRTVQGRPATVQEQAHAAIFLLDNTHMTGSTLYCDGGYTLR